MNNPRDNKSHLEYTLASNAVRAEYSLPLTVWKGSERAQAQVLYFRDPSDRASCAELFHQAGFLTVDGPR